MVIGFFALYALSPTRTTTPVESRALVRPGFPRSTRVLDSAHRRRRGIHASRFSAGSVRQGPKAPSWGPLALFGDGRKLETQSGG